MKTLFSKTGWLVMAAALTMGFGACSSEDNTADVQPTAAKTFRMTVGAGIDDGTTRATVDQEGTTRTMKFGNGDALFVAAEKEIGEYWYSFRGTLGEISNNTGTSAEFSGNVTVYKQDNAAPDPALSSLEGFFATLIPANNGGTFATEDRGDGVPDLMIPPMGLSATESINEAIACHTTAQGQIGAGNSVTLTTKTAFLNCAVTGLDASTAYDVRLGKGEDPVSVTTDGDGTLHFPAWFQLTNENEGEFYADIAGITFLIGTNKRVSLGSKTLYAKVYNVTRAAQDYTPFTVVDNNTDNVVEPEFGQYSFKSAADITLSGEADGVYISLSGATDRVVLNGVSGTGFENLLNAQGNLNLVLNGSNSISVGGNGGPYPQGQAIHANGTLKLSGNGTLTITCDDANFYGMFGSNYSEDNNSDANVLAASGYTVSRSDVTDNGDGTYTWTYTVSELVRPTITWTSPATADADGVFIYDDVYDIDVENPDITLSSESNGYLFVFASNYMGSGGTTVRLNGLNATYNAEQMFINTWNALTLDISGANTVVCKNNDLAILGYPTLKLRGNGTLTVTVNGDGKYTCGIGGSENYSDYQRTNTGEIDVTSALAAPGYTVTRSARTDNADGTYTWTYTVAQGEGQGGGED